MKKKFFLLIVLGLVIVILFFVVRPYYQFLTQTLGISPIKTLFSTDIKETNNNVNVLLLGKAGGNHDGPNLTDSISVANINLTTHKITLISMPRDIWSATLQEKINAAYAVGEAKEPGRGGIILAKAEIGAVIGQPVHYAVVINFEKFKELIDFLGGVDITVDKTFTDNQYPITGKENDLCNGDTEYKCRYETLTFQKGTTHMSGETALKFVRSRHGDNSEGSDFARGKRQQKVISAIIQKSMILVKSGNIHKIKDLYVFANKIIERDINNQDIASIAKHFLSTSKPTISSYALDMDFFEVPDVNVYGSYVLIPKDNDFTDVHTYVVCLISGSSTCKHLE
jgi:LCP family protein required for cell wall assembly